MRFGVLTVSDTCYKQENVDKSGPKIRALITAKYTESIVIHEDIVPDELERIKSKLIEWSDDLCDVIFTTGGTGIASRDVTPEATKAVIEKEVPGISFVMMSKSLAVTPFAMLSRAVCGIRKKTLIINFPGSVKAVTENFEAICDIIPHAISLLQNKFEDIQKIHSRMALLPQIQPKPETITLVQSTPTPTFLTPSNVIINAVANRPRTSPYEMVSMDNALGIVTMNVGQTTNTEVLPIINLMGRVIAEDVRSRDNLPPFTASIKDGYAVKSSDGAGLRTVVDVKAAGDNPQAQKLQNGQCVRISTGAPIPPGADAVVQVEDTELVKTSKDSTQEKEILIKIAPKSGQDIRPIGSDIPANTIVIPKGTVINAPEIGVLAAVGKTTATAFKQRSPQMRQLLNKETKDVVKNVIFYFDQQKNAGGFLYPIDKSNEAAAAASGVPLSTVMKIRKELKQNNEIVTDSVEIISDEEIINVRNWKKIETQTPKRKKRIKKISVPANKLIIEKPKSKSTVIEIDSAESNLNFKKIRLVTPKTDIENNSAKGKIIRNLVGDYLQHENVKNTIHKNGSDQKCKQIRIEAKKNIFLSQSTEKLAAVTSVNPNTINVIKTDVLSESKLKTALTVPKKEITTKKRPIILNKRAIKTMSPIIMTKKEFEKLSQKGRKINILGNSAFKTVKGNIPEENINIVSHSLMNILSDHGNEVRIHNSENICEEMSVEQVLESKVLPQENSSLNAYSKENSNMFNVSIEIP